MVNIEHQTSPEVNPKKDWIEIDHASANVADGPDIDAGVNTFFDTVVDPTDQRNVWIKPKDGVKVLGLDSADDEREVYLLEIPDGRAAYLIYGHDYGYGVGNEQYTVTVKVDSQLVFPLSDENS